MAFAYSASVQNDIALLVAKREYSTLGDDQKAMIDGGSIGSPRGAVLRTLTRLGSIANKVNVGDPTNIPDEWEPWFIAQAAADAARSFSTAEDEDLEQEARIAKIEAFQSFSMLSVSDSVSSSDLGLSVAAVRRHVLSTAASGDTPALPQISSIDTSLEKVLIRFWKMRPWKFRQSRVTINLAANGTITFDPSVTLEMVFDQDLFYTGDDRGKCLLADMETVNGYLANTDLDTGKPECYTTTKAVSAGSATTSILFNRSPDKAYELVGRVTFQLPARTNTTTMDAALALIPSDYAPLLKDWVLGSVLSLLGDRRGRAIVNEAMGEIERLGYAMDATEQPNKVDSRTGSRRRTYRPGPGDLGGFR